jgi:hypothetical protein
MTRQAARIRRGLSLAVAAWALGGRAFADDAVTTTFANGRNTVIPCQFVLNSILIPVPTPDKSFAYLILDTGAGASMLSEAFAQKIRVRGSDDVPAIGIGQAVSHGTTSGGIAFSLAGLTFRNAHWEILPDTSLDASFGLPVVGIFGMDLLREFVVRIDYAAQRVEFIKPEAFQPPTGDAVCLPLNASDQGFMVAANVKTEPAEAEGHFLLDTGNNGTFGLSKLFQDRHPELKFRPFAQSGASGIGGSLQMSEAICPALELGAMRIAHPLVDLDQAVQGVEAEMDGGIGNEIWRRFDVTLDLPHQKMYLRKNAHFGDSFSYVTAGMQVLALGARYDQLTVHALRPGSAGEKAGFHTGDVLVRIDELGNAPLTMARVYPLLHRPGVSHVVVKRDNKTIALTLALKNPEN